MVIGDHSPPPSAVVAGVLASADDEPEAAIATASVMDAEKASSLRAGGMRVLSVGLAPGSHLMSEPDGIR